MQQFQKDFIEFLVKSNALIFGDFTTKSGRKTPYFINTGRYQTGDQLVRLGWFYASAITEFFGAGFTNLYGPAYKGIPLVVSASMALATAGDHQVTISYNRKEAKDHGEKGVIIGHQYTPRDKVIIVEDVITAGTSIRESMALLQAQGNPDIIGVVVSVDRRERGAGDLSAIQEIKRTCNIPVYPIVTINDIIDHLHNRPVLGKIHIDDTMKQNIEAYLAQYGV